MTSSPLTVQRNGVAFNTSITRVLTWPLAHSAHSTITCSPLAVSIRARCVIIYRRSVFYPSDPSTSLYPLDIFSSGPRLLLHCARCCVYASYHELLHPVGLAVTSLFFHLQAPFIISLHRHSFVFPPITCPVSSPVRVIMTLMDGPISFHPLQLIHEPRFCSVFRFGCSTHTLTL